MGSSAPIISKAEFVPATRAGIAQAAQVISNGKLAIVPTETVYGIAVNLHSPEARRAARAIKSRGTTPESAAGSNPTWVIHVAQPEEALAWVPHISSLGQRLLHKALPGPVAFQIKLDPADEAEARQRLGDAADETIVDGFLTLRCPDFTQTQQVLAAVKAPVAIIGAGSAAQPGIFEAQEVPAALLQDAEGPALVLDAGPTRYRRSSTVVRVTGESYSVIRTGVIDARIIDKMADFTILFLCSGNTCRSPMAAALAARQIADRLGIAPSELPLRHIVVQSAGLHANRGTRAALEAMDAVKSLGGDLSTHFSQSVTTDLLRRADLIYTMTSAHRDEVLDIVPSADQKTFRLDQEGDIADPIGASLSVYQMVASHLNALLQERLGELPI